LKERAEARTHRTIRVVQAEIHAGESADFWELRLLEQRGKSEHIRSLSSDCEEESGEHIEMSRVLFENRN